MLREYSININLGLQSEKKCQDLFVNVYANLPGEGALVGTFEFSASQMGACMVYFNDIKLTDNTTVLEANSLTLGLDHTLDSGLYVLIEGLSQGDILKRTLWSHYVTDSLGLDSTTKKI